MDDDVGVIGRVGGPKQHRVRRGLTGLDISSAAIAQLAARAPARRDRLVLGDLSALPAVSVYPLLIGIQVFQHGDRAAAHAHAHATAIENVASVWEGRRWRHAV
jgi:hypothetical protein